MDLMFREITDFNSFVKAYIQPLILAVRLIKNSYIRDIIHWIIKQCYLIEEGSAKIDELSLVFKSGLEEI